MSSAPLLHPGIYERLLDLDLAQLLAERPEFQALLGKVDDEECPEIYTQFIGHLLREALHSCHPQARLPLVNRLVALLASADGLDYLSGKTLPDEPATRLLALRPPLPDGSFQQFSRPETPLSISSSLTGARSDRRSNTSFGKK